MGQREHHPEPSFDEVGILIAQEITVQGGRWMGAMVNTALDTFGTPRGIIHVDCGTIVVESLQVGAGMVRDAVDVIS